jgi:IQ calmodulin-binding motif
MDFRNSLRKKLGKLLTAKPPPIYFPEETSGAISSCRRYFCFCRCCCKAEKNIRLPLLQKINQAESTESPSRHAGISSRRAETSSRRRRTRMSDDYAATRIQTIIRGFLARRRRLHIFRQAADAYKAYKAELVRIEALRRAARLIRENFMKQYVSDVIDISLVFVTQHRAAITIQR